ncbi:hypothetical protein JRI60_47990 [Archangium violaceum]|uniref:hypothetical protein n=1 Tax=Archangium violaceum TaxID=83451 RepID=UPI00194E8105|nr:hypothetical protein [Archangium violaceum]QRN96650.1 hypothetical protein JRI60_47990 [Archangium violaceum]
MHEEKKSETSGEAVKQVGPYQLHEQVPQDNYSRGELYRDTHETSGETTLVFKPAATDEKGSGPLTDWQVRLTSSASDGYVSMKAENPPRSVATDEHSVESLVCTFEEVREAVGRMDHALHAANKPRPWWRLGLALSGGAAVLVVALLSATLAPVDEMRVQQQVTVKAWTTDVHVDPVPVRSGEAPRPVPNQKHAPCAAGLEREVSGVCWIATEHAPPNCPPQTVSYDGKCLLPVAKPRPVPTSVDGGGEAR